MRKIKVWDPVVRIFHWSLVAGFTANALLTDPEGKTHEAIGLALVALVALRIAWGFVGSHHARFADFRPSIGAGLGQLGEMATGRRRIHAGHSPLGALMIYNLIAVLIVIGFSGYAMTTYSFFGSRWVEEVHEIAVRWAELSVLAHVAAVVFESRRLGINLPKSMVTGYKTLPATGTQE
ncbi:cytochrome b/b6 domain-containing protein [Defluviimonas salinarum]|uniref:Cytochrome b/b6 domain-containing protein n=1 Tax=Defluviimonas salinarum TaxID=2992147 RepID=A0ABT3IX60_9RHOB|nr:cytochrome b/b6 domain-containing protein [Defluviimonas salinarum]MCW3780014.1 cytochrome b/b6 domain-containing protein [Defluviimonas salinarum]